MVIKSVGIAELKAHLSRYLREAGAGATVEVLDRGRPVARLVPLGAGEDVLVLRPARSRLSDLELPPPGRGDFDIVEVLLEARQSQR